MPQGLGDVLKLSFAKMWTSLEITFLFEHFLLELRRLAFDGKSHLCKAALPSLHGFDLARLLLSVAAMRVVLC